MPSQTEQIKERLDIVAFLQEHIELKSAGANYKALCPFHQEKTPSFMVSPSRQIFKCFGCGKGGDIFTFVQEYEGLEFPDALRLLADKAGVHLEKENYRAKSHTNRIYDALAAATEFYHNCLLNSPDAIVARNYLNNRGVDDITRDVFCLGYSPQDWQTLVGFLQSKGFSQKDTRDAGLIGIGRYGEYDRFRGRLMFPIWDERGRVVGFGGRILEEDNDQAKYINSPQTSAYDKSRILYALDKAKNSIRREKFAVIVEGYMDVIACHKAGITNVVGSSGTALTQNQLQLLKRFTKTVALCFDMDKAGIEAAIRSYVTAGELGLNTKVVRLPKGMDPDDMVKKNPALFQKAVSESTNLLDYYFSITLEEVDLGTVEGKKQIRDKLLPIIADLTDSVERSYYLRKLGAFIQVDAGILLREADSSRYVSARKAYKPATPALAAPPRKHIVSDYIEHLIAIMLEYAELLPDDAVLPKLSLKNLPLDALYKEAQYAYNTGKFGSADVQLWKKTHTIAVDDALMLASKDYADLDARSAGFEFLRLAREINRYVQTRKREKLIYELRMAEDKNNETRIEEIIKEVDLLSNTAKKLS